MTTPQAVPKATTAHRATSAARQALAQAWRALTRTAPTAFAFPRTAGVLARLRRARQAARERRARNETSPF